MNTLQITAFNPKQAAKLNYIKENKFYKAYILVGFSNNEIRVLVELRLYATESRVYAHVWAKDNIKGTITGTAYAGGCGYNKAQDAAYNALLSAGIEYNSSSHGIRDMLMAIGSLHPEATAFKVIEV